MGRLKSQARFVVEDRGYETPCHVWQRAINSGGYGMIRIGARVVGAHVLAFEAAHGPVPAGHEVDHLCAVRSCVNGDHLEAVTDAENTRRGRGTRLTADEVAEIRAGHVRGLSNLDLAERYGVSASWVSRIITGRTVNRHGIARVWA